MKALTPLTLAASVVLLTGGAAQAQIKTIQGESVSMTVTIEAIDQNSRTLTVKDDKGIFETLEVPRAFPRFRCAQGRRQDYRPLLRQRCDPSQEARRSGDRRKGGAVTPTAGARPGGTVATQQTVTVTITAIDPKVPSITVKGPNGYVYSRKVDDKNALAKVKVGDKLDITWTEALLISVEPAK